MYNNIIVIIVEALLSYSSIFEQSSTNTQSTASRYILQKQIMQHDSVWLAVSQPMYQATSEQTFLKVFLLFFFL